MGYKVEDCVHGEIVLPEYATQFIESKEFQRLYKIKQLGKQNFGSAKNVINEKLPTAGVTNFVFENSTHTRAEHCIGTAYLCIRILEKIEENSGIEIDRLHKKCVVVS